MASFVKLSETIITSTIWTEDAETKVVWITLLAKADKHGEVLASIPGLAQIANVSLAATEAAIEKFLAPDRYSRTPENEGRRIEKLEDGGGWRLLNYEKYRLLGSKEQSQEAAAIRKRRSRERQRQQQPAPEPPAVPPCDMSRVVTGGHGSGTHDRDIAEAEAKAEAEASTVIPSKKETSTPPKAPPPEKTPPAPQGGSGVGEADPVFPKGWRAMSLSDKKKTKVLRNTPGMIRIGAWFDRPAKRLWSIEEGGALLKINPSMEEVELLEIYYLADADDIGERDYRRKDLITLLNNWSGEQDRAKIFITEKGITAPDEDDRKLDENS